MFDIKTNNLIDKIVQLFYRLRLWNSTNNSSFRLTVLKLVQFLLFAFFVACMAGGACMSDDMDERIFLTVAAMINGVIVYRMACIIRNKNEILMFVKELGNHSIESQRDYQQVLEKLEILTKFAKAFIFMCVLGVTFAFFVPMVSSEKKLVFNIAIPPQWKSNEIVFWVAHFYSVIACTYSSMALLLSVIIWYLMVNFALKYEILGHEFRNLGKNLKETSDREKQESLLRHLVRNIRVHRKLNNITKQFVFCFQNLFFLQISTSGICICGSIYTLTFSSERNFLQNGIYCVFIAYSFFDIFTLMYLGNELKLSNDRLSYCLFESDWIEQSKLSRQCIMILVEILQQPRELIIGKVYPLNLKTFTKILNGAYSMFNILKNLN